MYERFYHLRERPFALTPDPDYLYPSRVHKEALSYLRYGIESHAGFVVITGAIGSGKTTLLQTLLRGVVRETTLGRIVNTLLEPRELVEKIRWYCHQNAAYWNADENTTLVHLFEADVHVARIAGPAKPGFSIRRQRMHPA